MDKNIVVVFDFDKTIIDVDSDDWVVDELGIRVIFDRFRNTMPYNTLMDTMMKVLHARRRNVEDIKEVLKTVPIHPRVVSAIKKAHDLGCDLRIVSDANTFFIETILDHHGIKNCFSEINTNPSHVDELGRLRISPRVDFNSLPHGCNRCPPNMCKGMIIERIQNSFSNGERRIIYLGDGNNDFCPCLKLNDGDFMMPRKYFPVWDLICDNITLLKAEIHGWNYGEEESDILLGLIDKIIKIDQESGISGFKSSTIQPLPIDHSKFENVPKVVRVLH